MTIKETIALVVITICIFGIIAIKVSKIGDPVKHGAEPTPTFDNDKQYAEAILALVTQPSTLAGNSTSKFKISVNGVIKNLYVEIDKADTSDRGRRAEILVNYEPAIYPPRCMLIRAKYCNDTGHEIPVKRGDIVSLFDSGFGLFVPTIHWQADFIPDKDFMSTPSASPYHD